MTPNQLREERERLGWIQPVAARRLGLSLRQYKYLEAGETSTGEILSEVPVPIALSMLSFGFAYGVLKLIEARDGVSQVEDNDDE